VQRVEHPELGAVSLLVGVFKVDGVPTARGARAPRLDEHRGELLG
jgi:hypothetical protein